MLRMAPLLLTIALGSAGASGPDQATPPAQVPAEQRDDYWTPKSEKIRAPLPPATSLRRMSQRVEVGYTIDTRGRVRDAEVVSFSPQDSNPSWALLAIKANRFEPGAKNPSGQPIRTSTVVMLGPAPAR